LKIMGTDYPTPDGTAVRDYIHVLDLADAHIRALASITSGVHEIYNLGSGIGNSVREVIDAIADVTGVSPKAIETERRAGDPPMLVATNAKIRAALGWTPEFTLRQIIADAWDFFQR
jgi:UDP-glucose 4-epimerase